jgi:hypothetical protein
LRQHRQALTPLGAHVRDLHGHTELARVHVTGETGYEMGGDGAGTRGVCDEGRLGMRWEERSGNTGRM